jgi:hypothetical protein
LDSTLSVFSFFYLCLGGLKLLGVTFAATAAQQAYLLLPNPIMFFLPNRAVLGVAAVLEICVGVYGLQPKRPVSRRAGLLLWLAAATIFYKMALVVVQYQGPCGCLYGINMLIPLRPDVQRWVADVISLSALLASVSALVCSSWQRSRAVAPPA